MTEQMLCRVGGTVLEALRLIDENTKGAVFVVDDDDRFMGTLTDGDIRRAFISNCTLTTTMHELIRDKESLWMPASTPLEELVRLSSSKIRIIPLLDNDHRVVDYFELKAEFRAPIAATELNGNELQYVVECLAANWISSQGMFVSAFEERFAEYIGSRYGVVVSNGTVALHLALLALEVGPGDEVIVPDLTFAASINAVLYTGATPVLVDVDSESWCLDPLLVERAITPRTRVIMPVHLYGRPCNMTALSALADKHGLQIVEDCAEAHGATFLGQKVGSFGAVACFSFFGNKILTMGEGGICLTNDAGLAEKMRVLRDHGMSKTKRYWHEHVGYNYRLTNLQAAIGVAQLERVELLLEKRRQIARWYLERLKSCGAFSFPADHPDCGPVTWLFSCLIDDSAVDRERLIELAGSRRVDIRPFFHPLHLMPPYQRYSVAAGFPVSEELSRTGISLPTVISMDESQYDQICDIILNAVEEIRGVRHV